MDMPFLPRLFLMQHVNNGPYLSVVASPPANRPSGLIRPDESQFGSPRAKFAAETSQTGDASLVHIRSCYNNKYWVAREQDRVFWIAASADKPEEDQTNPGCTLFRTSRHTNSSGKPSFQLFCISRSMYLFHIAGAAGGLAAALTWGPMFPAVDWQTLLILPSQVSFGSEELKDQYLCSRVIDKHYNYHRFESGLDIGSLLVAHELFPTHDGNYRIKNLHFGRFWRLGTRWIWADAADNNHTSEATFSFVKLNDAQSIAVRNLGNNLFCAPDTREGKVNCLRAEHPTIIGRTRLLVEERVLKREIQNIQYRYSDVRIYEEGLEEVSNAIGVNKDPMFPATMILSLRKTESLSTYWSNSISLNLNVNAELKVTPIPLIVEGKLQWSVDFEYTYEWRKERTTTTTTQVFYVVVVPPLTTVKVTLMCTKAACDVPYSYTQRDLLPNGQWVTTVKDDGIYNGFNTDNFYFYSERVN
ncbi:hypothetical protein L1987_81987 [Smallanthus sonchifolius]|uniref:Uncharacterized protein n=1 Tax=Smallanthus sonchifolius TaxID=185202 RepID=A0ACB8YSP4_9ASTR|nr:hypothetical protein L1987_81987 [Smallanthus sonchifolius]